ncbi:MAG: general secretion pathway protein GspE [Epsilonproteobacteria bacterium]|nr:general secretion pathway protein GspE [Campylobacterota bacterium]NPA63847.1 Flp pilus assembly complex ATPase component [Campylobacterota bacterium]
MRGKDLGQALVQEGLISQEELQKARQMQQNSHKSLEQILVDEGFINQKDLLRLLGALYGYETIDLGGIALDHHTVLKFPLQLLRKAKAIPFKEDGEYLHVATADPFNYEALEVMERIASKPLKIYLTLEDDVEALFHRLSVLEDSKAIVEEVKQELEGAVQKPEGQSAVAKLIDLVLKDSIHRRATDIHLEPDEHKAMVRVRIDGVLYETFMFDKDVYNLLSSRIKLMGGLDISEKRKPQDGRFSQKIDEKLYDFRLSTMPTIYGESLAMRVLDREKALMRLEELGFEQENLERFKEMIRSPYGIVLITGPTGSGKTTTLYAALNEIKSIHNKVMTIEDPVEYRLPLVQQMQVNEKAGLTFAVAARAFLRQDPDVMLIGEIRDYETLDAASGASLTGHLVFTTLHTNDAVGAVTRLAQLGLKPHLIADAIIGIVAQRLVRKICPHCKIPHKISSDLEKKIEPYLSAQGRFYIGKGCPKCDFTGYYGRTMISEVLEVDEEVADLISKGASKFDIFKFATERKGFRPMISDGIKKALDGVTTVEEVLRVARDKR